MPLRRRFRWPGLAWPGLARPAPLLLLAIAFSGARADDEYMGYGIEEYDSWTCQGDSRSDLNYTIDQVDIFADVLDGWAGWDSTLTFYDTNVTATRWDDDL